MKAGTFVAAWKRGGYWWARSSVISSSPYFAWRAFETSVCGVYVKLSSSPVSGWINGGKELSAVCGMLNVKCFTWCPIRSRAASRAGLVKTPGLKVMRKSPNKVGAARVLKSWQTSRRLAKSCLGNAEMRFSRQRSVSQNLRKVLLSDSTRLQTEATVSEAERRVLDRCVGGLAGTSYKYICRSRGQSPRREVCFLHF
jgi:hypothetical protein